MKLKSISGLVLIVKDLDATVKFYEKLGFDIKKREKDSATAYVNWFWVEFVDEADLDEEFKKDVNAKRAGAGQSLCINVEEVDEFYKTLVTKDLKPYSEPNGGSSGRREFVMHDPDGYKLVFFSKK